jgi:putative membrane protein
MLGFFRLARAILGHLAITGGVALGDSVVQQLLGHGLAARLSARLGEGVINGLMTVRVGIAALRSIRPLPYLTRRELNVTEFMIELTKLTSKEEKPE